MSHQQAADYRQRAAHLRTLATALENTPAMHLDRLCGVSTWHGPRASACEADLFAAQRGARQAIDDVRATAWRFERTAEELDFVAIAAEIAGLPR